MKQKVAVILFHTGETKALLPWMRVNQNNIRIILAGQAAKKSLPTDFSSVIIPSFISESHCENDAFQQPFPQKDIDEIIKLCEGYDHVVLGSPAEVQLQVAAALPPDTQRIVYFDAGSNPEKIEAFAPHADALVFTSVLNQEFAHQIVSQLHLKDEDKPDIISARHGDFDQWLNAYLSMTADQKEMIRQNLCVSTEDKVIVWAGGYGEKEIKAFKMFLETFSEYKTKYKLRITPHPGVMSTSPEKRENSLKTYYQDPLVAAGFSQEEIKRLIVTTIPTQMVASIALGLFSAGSTTGAQAVWIGTRAKYVIPAASQQDKEPEKFEKPHEPLPFKIKNLNTPSGLSTLFSLWIEKQKERRQVNDPTYRKATDEKKLGIPKNSTQEVLEAVLNHPSCKRKT